MASSKRGTQAASDPVSLVRRLYAVTSSGNMAELDDVLSPDVVDHGVGGDGEELRGSEAVRADVEAFRRSFPDVQIMVEDVFASEAGDRVAVRWRMAGTHKDTFQGIPGSGRSVSMRGIDVLRVEGGRIAERWGSSDELGLLQQLVDRRQGERRSTRAPGEGAGERRRGGRRRSDVDPALGSE